ncbi:MAG: tetratricopeptide repeat protein, partial [Anaerolineae bacterium]|nr:tetratricopeptide repeat protein [Anaerolineae bacterium]
LGQAWAHLRQGNAVDAANEFQQMLKSAPNHIDALYGLGLTHAVQGQNEAAQSTFQKCLELVEKERAGGFNDRWEMLHRMLEQRVKESKSA